MALPRELQIPLIDFRYVFFLFCDLVMLSFSPLWNVKLIAFWNTNLEFAMHQTEIYLCEEITFTSNYLNSESL